jgi:peptidyl-prolyl cis-trans isomerase C
MKSAYPHSHRASALAAALAAILTATSVQAADAAKPAAAPATAPAAAAAPEAPQADVRLATINGVPYSLDLFRIFYLERLQQTQSQDTPEAQQQSFNDFINLVVTAQQAPALKLTERHDVQLGLELQKMKLYSSVALQAMAMDIQPTEEELKKAYDEAVKEVKQDQYKARHILVKEEAEAKKLIAELDKKADFTELAKKHSIGPAGKNGGDLDWFTAGQMVKPFSDAAAALEKGSYTKTPVQTQFGWHVILLEDKRVAEPPSFEDAKPQLIAAIQRNKLGEQIIELRKTTKLELNEDVIKLKEDPAKGEAEKTAPAKAEPAKK